MRCVMSEVPPELLAWRRRTGADRFDEVWAGVLHVVPVPSPDHQRVVLGLAVWLTTHWVDRPGREVLLEGNVAPPDAADWQQDYRVPDLMLRTSAARCVEHPAWFAGAPEVVVEVRSPGDETDAKLGFYARCGAREIWVIDRDTRAVALQVAADDGRLSMRAPDAAGWLHSELGIALRPRDGHVELRCGGASPVTGRVP